MGIKIVKRPDLLRKTTVANEQSIKAFKRAIIQHATKIHQLALKGKGFDGKPLPRYKASTKKLRGKYGLQTNPPNLSQTGGMLRALSTKIKLRKNGTSQGAIFIRNTSQGAFRTNKKVSYSTISDKKQRSKTVYGKRVNATVKARNVIKLGFKFFGMSPKDKQKMTERVKNAFLRGFKK